MITATYPLTGLDSVQPSTTAAARPHPWGFWATLGWFGVAFVAFFAAAIVCGFSYGFGWALTHPGQALDVDSPVLAYLVTAVSVPAAALVLALATRRAGWSMWGYLGLVLPRLRHVVIGIGSLVAFGVFISAVAYMFPSVDQSAVMDSEYRSAMGSTAGLILFWLTLVVTAPVAEEIIFRGFLFRGWSESRLGVIGALMLTSLIFAVIHLQYSVQGMAVVFGLGLLLGVMRWRSGSTVLVILMHAVWNLTVGTAVMLSA